MKEHPIICTGESVRSILAGTKTQTRRILAPGDHPLSFDPITELDKHSRWHPGDKLWVRETWCDVCPLWPWEWCGCGTKEMRAQTHRVCYAAGPRDVDGQEPDGKEDRRQTTYRSWKSPIHMPRWASRIDLEVLSVRVQRLQDISEEDAKAEGVDGHVGGEGPVSREALLTEPGLWHPRFYRDGFEWAWSNLHDKPSEFGASWASNPWIWAIEFKSLAEHTTHKET